ncbi:hypothetical protein PMAYCL1PPCAC_30547 [Pristionchus mayeri]|uniref:LNR domain-containing protein n=1 Tax=Pristionchus mayeri TaxID=1317129 RepID=A0AAN5DDS9_9BILA|nr:hypothetical protein PMAYCL1PPCAC_30547 [Pristionchus mayeri]
MQLPLVCSVVLIASIVQSHGLKNHLPAISEEEANEEIQRAMTRRATESRIRNYPNRHTDRREARAGQCSEYCMKRMGDGICQRACYSNECFYDLGDCASLPFRRCEEMDCDAHCSSDCRLRACSGCHIKRDSEIYLYFFSPFFTPLQLFRGFANVENRIEEKTGLTLELGGLWGFQDGASWPINFIYESKGPVRPWLNETLSLFRVRAGFVDTNDRRTLEVLRKMGTSNRFLATVSPMILSPSESQKNDLLFESDWYSEERERLQQQRQMESRRARN